jgi:hypothetical protein
MAAQSRRLSMIIDTLRSFTSLSLTLPEFLFSTQIALFRVLSERLNHSLDHPAWLDLKESCQNSPPFAKSVRKISFEQAMFLVPMSGEAVVVAGFVLLGWNLIFAAWSSTAAFSAGQHALVKPVDASLKVGLFREQTPATGHSTAGDLLLVSLLPFDGMSASLSTQPDLLASDALHPVDDDSE